MWAEGIIVTDNSEVVAKPGMALHELLETSAATHAKFPQIGPPRDEIRFDELLLDGNPIQASAVFIQDRLTFFTFQLTREADYREFGELPHRSWSNFDELWEKRGVFYDDWLKRHIGEPDKVRLWRGAWVQHLQVKKLWGSIASVTNLSLPDACIDLDYSV
jgi:hypothetical protein